MIKSKRLPGKSLPDDIQVFSPSSTYWVSFTPALGEDLVSFTPISYT